MTVDTVPLKLHKANLELQIQINRLMQEGGKRWLEVASQASNEGITEALAEIEALRKAENWQTLATLPGESFWRVLQQRVGDTQELSQAAIKNQTAFASGLQEAIEGWQKAVSEAVGNVSSAQPIQDIFKQWTSVWSVPGAKAQEKTGKGA
ncbi:MULTISPECIES: phasin family protein [Brucella/Ochrobactrum group]|uniref:phasin family protein n=1 Tax=Brucella/Ochrobactrum group TaxID=2826938 RepID=UPI00124C56B9|nr:MULTISPECIES: phasin family protein [Brucella/Ochrobactrum group]KAB2758343.1 phasin family protein [Brucella anthropi]MCQ9147177.1 phasin family protein [Ochrobactrum sp. BTU2]